MIIMITPSGNARSRQAPEREGEGGMEREGGTKGGREGGGVR
jgi:hypothetical protein